MRWASRTAWSLRAERLADLPDEPSSAAADPDMGRTRPGRLSFGMPYDTAPEAARLQLDALRALSGEARLEQALELSEAVRALSEAGRRDREAHGERPVGSQDTSNDVV